MKKILILCEDNILIQRMVNSVVGKNTNFRLIGISNTIKDAKKIMEKNKPDYIITTIRPFISEVYKMFSPVVPKIILISPEPLKSKTDNIIFLRRTNRFCEDLIELGKILRKAVRISKKDFVTNLLTDFGFDFRISGTPYILEAILYKDEYFGDSSLEKLVGLYEYVAKANNTSVKKVTWAINRSVDYMYARHTKRSYHTIEKYFKIKYPEKITPKIVINLISHNISNF